MTIIVRGQLWVLGAGHPSRDVREHAIDAAQALGDGLTASSGLVHSMPETSTRMRSRRPEGWPSNGIGQLLTAWSASLTPSNGGDGPAVGPGVDLDRASVRPTLDTILRSSGEVQAATDWVPAVKASITAAVGAKDPDLGGPVGGRRRWVTLPSRAVFHTREMPA
jgi:hypothetical protein